MCLCFKTNKFIRIPTRKNNYLYNALGQKLEKKVTNGSTIITTDYQGGFQYEDEVLRFFATSEGYVSYDEQSESFTYIYNYTDHLGNIRLSYKEGDRTEDPPAIVDENHYYPFGLKHTNYGFVPQQELAYAKKFNHREWQDEFNLNIYAMDMRQYDPAIARWVVHDPVIHHSLSPYNGMDNNPVYWADPSGGNAIHSSFANLFSWENRFHYNWDTGSYFMFGQELSNDFAMSTLDNIIISLTYDLPPIYIGGGSETFPGNFASMVEQHVYAHSPFYSHLPGNNGIITNNITCCHHTTTFSQGSGIFSLNDRQSGYIRSGGAMRSGFIGSSVGKDGVIYGTVDNLFAPGADINTKIQMLRYIMDTKTGLGIVDALVQSLRNESSINIQMYNQTIYDTIWTRTKNPMGISVRSYNLIERQNRILIINGDTIR